MKKALQIIMIIFLLASCNGNKDIHDASGTFEAVETIVSSEATGIIKVFNITEGQILKKGDTIGYIDTTQLYLKKKQLLAQVKSVLGKKPQVTTQLAALQEQLKQSEREQERITNLVNADAATPKQLDDAHAQVAILKKQIQANKSSLDITNSGLTGETLPMEVQVEQVNDQLAKSRIINEVNGTVLTTYAEKNEMAVAGKPLYKIADMATIILRAYITGDQIRSIKLNQKVKVLVDSSDKSYKEYPGTIEWISDKAEFTPKTIQTKNERANLVYAIKINVVNDGYLKIGMYGEIKL